MGSWKSSHYTPNFLFPTTHFQLTKTTPVQNKTAIVILNWNGQKHLEKFLPSVIEHSSIENVDIYVADNGSTDNSVEFIQAEYPQIKLILLDKNYGYTGGYNKALAQIKAKYFVLLNSDVEVTANWIKPVIEFMDKDPSIAACQPKILSYSNKEHFEYAGAAGGFIDKYGYPFCRGRILNSFEKDEGQYNDTREIFWATGACMFVRANLFKLAGGLDDNFFAHMEEIDLCWRFKNMGYKVFYNSASTVYHLGGGALPNNSATKLYLNYRNNLFLLYKNLPDNKRFSIIFVRLILDVLSAFVYLISFKFAFFGAVFKAHISFYKERKNINSHKQIGKLAPENIAGIYHKSIILDYFIRKNKKFTQLQFNKINNNDKLHNNNPHLQ